MVVFALLLNRVLGFANFMFNLKWENSLNELKEDLYFCLFQFDVRWDLTTCNKGSQTKFQPFGIPLYFSYEGEVVIRGKNCKKWLWRTGGHNTGEATTEEVWCTVVNEQGDVIPIIYDNQYIGSPSSKTSTVINADFPAFTENVDEEKFILRNFCEA